MTKRTWLLTLLFLAVIAPAIVVGSWALTETAVQATSGQQFCTLCHSMKPFAEAYAKDVHGGNNAHGLVAPCAACHLPHNSPAETLIAKAKTGIQDVWWETLSIFSEPDWVGNLKNRESFVFDSGCLTCHANLANASGATPTATLAHTTYFADPTRMKCVSCHSQVGHKDLVSHLQAAPAAGDQSQTAQETPK